MIMIKDNNIIDIPFGTKHIRFENLSKEQIECLIKLSETHQLSSIRKSTLILTKGPKQKTLEEAAKNYSKSRFETTTAWTSFVDGAEWQAERMYSEENLIGNSENSLDTFLLNSINFSQEDREVIMEAISMWLEQLKKK